MADTRGDQPTPGQLQLDRRATDALEWARWAVDRWSEFPVAQTPRPVILADSRVHIETGFATGEAKMAFIEGRIESRVSVPAAVLAELARQSHPDHSRSAAPLLITGVELGATEFVTDRGRQRLPAWRLTAQDALGPIWVLDASVVDWQPLPDAGGPPPNLQAPGQDPGARVEVGPDDRTLVVHWLGASPQFERYQTAEIVESAQAFTVVPVGTNIGPPGYRTLAGHVHRVPAVLEERVGARVFVDLHGHAGQVIRSS